LPPHFDANAFCDAAATLYICAAGREQRALAPLVVGLLGEIRDAAYRRAAGGRARPPVLMAIDEAANIAPVPDLPAMVSEGPGQGLLTMVCLQDLSQARSRWGAQADGFVSLFGTTIVLRGVADLATLEVLSALAGDVEVPTRTVGAAQGPDGRPRPSTSVSTVRQRRLPVDEIARGWPGLALALDAQNRLGWVRLSPAHRSTPWRQLVRAEPERRPDRENPRATPTRTHFGSPLDRGR
jgi:type IV secretory pathway TraG/TraD family ATPase VirD4